MNTKKVAFGTLAFFISSFVIQGVLGFMLAGEYFMSIPIMREAAVVYLGMSATVVMGIAFSILYPMTRFSGSDVIKGLKFGLLIGLIMVPFVALDIPGRFQIPSVETWIIVQGILGFIHFAVAGILIALIYRTSPKAD